MKRDIHLVRGELELGVLPEREVRDLLSVGFLLTSDTFWTRGMSEWQALADFERGLSTADASPGWLTKAARTAGRAAGKLKSTTLPKVRVVPVAERVLADFLGPLKELVARSLSEDVIRAAKERLQDDEFMRKTFGAVYDCLPKPVYRFVKEQDFIAFCLERRKQLLNL